MSVIASRLLRKMEEGFQAVLARQPGFCYYRAMALDDHIVVSCSCFVTTALSAASTVAVQKYLRNMPGNENPLDFDLVAAGIVSILSVANTI